MFPARQRRPQYTLFAKFDDVDIPTVPMTEAVEKLNKKVTDPGRVQELKLVSISVINILLYLV